MTEPPQNNNHMFTIFTAGFFRQIQGRIKCCIKKILSFALVAPALPGEIKIL